MNDADLAAMPLEQLDAWIQRRGAEAREARAQLELAKTDIALGWKVINARMARPARSGAASAATVVEPGR